MNSKKKILLFSVTLVFGVLLLYSSNVIGFDLDPGIPPPPRPPPADTTPPTLTLINPSTSGQVFENTVTFKVTATDSSGISSVGFNLNNDFIGYGVKVSGTNYYECVFDTKTYPNDFHTLKVTAIDTKGNYRQKSITIEIANGDGIVKKWAVIVGVSNYLSEQVSDLDYCDDDATRWKNFLDDELSFDSVKLFGDLDYTTGGRIATEYHVKTALQTVVETADEDDVIAFISIGHGTYDSTLEDYYLGMWDLEITPSDELETMYSVDFGTDDGQLYSEELVGILESTVANRLFIFLDHCYSGGFGPNILDLEDTCPTTYIYLTTSCSATGSGYDITDSSHVAYEYGLWTFYFLKYSWIDYYGSSASVSIENVFSYAYNNFDLLDDDKTEDLPQKYDNYVTKSFYLNG